MLPEKRNPAIEAACRDMWGKDYLQDIEQMYGWMRDAIHTYEVEKDIQHAKLGRPSND